MAKQCEIGSKSWGRDSKPACCSLQFRKRAFRQAETAARERAARDRFCHPQRYQRPTRGRPVHDCCEARRFGLREMPVAIIQEYRHGLLELSAGNYQIDRVVRVDVSRLDYKAALRRDKSDRLPTRRS